VVLEVVGDTLYASQRPNSLHPLLTSVGAGPPGGGRQELLQEQPLVHEGPPEAGRGATEDFKRVLELDPRKTDALRMIPQLHTDKLHEKARIWQKLQTARPLTTSWSGAPVASSWVTDLESCRHGEHALMGHNAVMRHNACWAHGMRISVHCT